MVMQNNVLGTSTLGTDVDLTGLSKGLTKGEGKVRKSIGAASAVVASLGAFALKAGDEINTAYGKIQAGTGATGAKLDELKASFHALYGETAAGAEDVSRAIESLNTRFGLTGTALEEVATMALQFSEATGGDGVAAMDNLGRAMVFFGIDASET